MLLTITTTHRPATDLGFLLHKHPDRVQRFDAGVGQAQVFYPETSAERCTAALMLEIDPVGLVRRGSGDSGFALEQYVNDRPYVASSFMSVAIARVFHTAMSGTCKGHEELVASTLPLKASLAAVGASGGEEFVRRLFEPLGYRVDCVPIMLDDRFPEWGESRYVSLTLTGEVRLADLLSHLYVLLPVLDDQKHYWVDQSEIEKLLRRGSGWLAGHPEQQQIVRRYLKRQASLYRPAFAAIDEEAGGREAGDAEPGEAAVEEALATRPLREQRLDAIQQALGASGARRVLDLGCGPGALLRRLIVGDYDELVGIDISPRALQACARALKLDQRLPGARPVVRLLQSALTYRDERLCGYDAAVLVEVIEHLDPDRLAVAAENVFGVARPATVLVSTPNAEYNVRYEGLDGGEFRHRDHRFEFTRDQFQGWGRANAEHYGYGVEFQAIGPVDDEAGSPTQLAVFKR